MRFGTAHHHCTHTPPHTPHPTRLPAYWRGSPCHTTYYRCAQPLLRRHFHHPFELLARRTPLTCLPLHPISADVGHHCYLRAHLPHPHHLHHCHFSPTPFGPHTPHPSLHCLPSRFVGRGWARELPTPRTLAFRLPHTNLACRHCSSITYRAHHHPHYRLQPPQPTLVCLLNLYLPTGRLRPACTPWVWTLNQAWVGGQAKPGCPWDIACSAWAGTHGTV